ncbi:Hypothetical predicted protein [Mytilus galloprovincialis]|nr:Hypothetical predicted protein [Mytilus galloprovincialis]
MDIKIEENEDFSVENDIQTGTYNSRASDKNNCMQDQDQDEEHASSFKNKTTEIPLENVQAGIADLE